ncbi:MAG TPA: hypothetical protein VMT24_08720, partial [Aggregatilineaceae bacterium]|nr:hypothetical protein [Aggregatilineaceae bacterium]
MTSELAETGVWLRPFGEMFLGLDASAVIQRVIGANPGIVSRPVEDLRGASWQEFITRFAGESARDGLRYVWRAVARRGIAPDYWPLYVPFKTGVIARLRAVDGDPAISFAVHLSSSSECHLDSLIGTHALEAVDRMVRLGQHVFRGTDGPLTDLQVREIGGIVNNAEYARQLLEDLRAEVFTPANVAPRPYRLTDLFSFSEHDFTSHRIVTHQLAITCHLSSEVVYCHPTIHDVTWRILSTLIAGIAVQSAVILSDQVGERAQAVLVQIEYHSEEPALEVECRLDPL